MADVPIVVQFILYLAAFLIITNLFLLPLVEDLLAKEPNEFSCSDLKKQLVNGTGGLSARELEKYTANYVGRCLT